MAPSSLWRDSRALAVAVLSGCLVSIVILQQFRGIWLDEASGLWLAAPGLPLGAAFRERWISDVHPPLYSAYAWLLEPLFGGSVRAMRAINLGGLLLAALPVVQAWRRGMNRDFLRLFAVFVGSSPFFILYAAEFRSYFLQMLFAACLIVQLRLLHDRRASWPTLAATAILSINLHYLGSPISLVLIGAQVVALWSAGRGRAALGLAMIGVAGTLPLAAAFAAMLSVNEPVAVNHVTALGGLVAIAVALGCAVVPHVAALVLLRQAPAPAAQDRSFLMVLVGAFATIAAGYALLNLVTHNLLPRHMIAAAPIGAAILALLLQPVVARDGRRFALVCLNALLLAVAATGYGLANKRWETNLGRIEAARAACPQTRLYALHPMSLLDPGDALHRVPAIDHFFASTYRMIVPDAQVVPNGRAIRADGSCPALLWIEHHYARPHLSDEQLVRLAGFRGPIRIARLQRGDARALLAISR